MKKQIACTLSLFSFCLLMADALGGGMDEVFRPPLLDVNRLLDVEGRREAFQERFGYVPQADVIVLNEVDQNEEVAVFAPPPPPPLPLGNNLGIFANVLQSEAARRLRAAQLEPSAPQVVQNEQLSFADQAVLKQREMAARREAKAAAKQEPKDNKHAVKLPPSNPHMQALFAEIAKRAKVVEQQIAEEEARRAEAQAHQQEVPEVVLTEAELEQKKLEAERLREQKKLEAEERARLCVLRNNLLQDITSVGLRQTKLKTNHHKRTRNHSFAGTPSVPVQVDGPVHTSLVIVPNYEMDVHEEEEEGDWDDFEPLFSDITEEIEEQVEEEKKEEATEVQASPGSQTGSWFGYFRSWLGGGGAVQVVEEIEEGVALPPQVELIWNEIAEIVQLIEIGRPQNILDSVVGLGIGMQFFIDIKNNWKGAFHRYLYYQALINLIEARYQEANRIEEELVALSNDIGPEILEPIGEALDEIRKILEGINTCRQLHSVRVAQDVVNPVLTDFLMNEFPHFTETMTRAFDHLNQLFIKKGSMHKRFDPLKSAQAHMLKSMAAVAAELKEPESVNNDN